MKQATGHARVATTKVEDRPLRLRGIGFWPVKLVMGAIDAPLRRLQKAAGLNGMAAFFLLPNMAIFGIFVLLPLVINFAYSMTGGAAIFLPHRDFRRARPVPAIFSMHELSRPQHLRRGHVLDRGRATPPPLSSSR